MPVWLSVDLIAKLYVVSAPTITGVPDNTPVVAFNVSPLGILPLNNAYVTAVPGNVGIA